MARVWCNHRFSPGDEAMLRAGMAPHELIVAAGAQATNLSPGAIDPRLDEAEVAFGQPPVKALDAPRLRWVHLTSAGWNRYDQADLRAALQRRGVALTTSSTVYAEPCAEHALAMMLGLARQLPEALATQLGDRSWPSVERRARSRLLAGQTVVLLGYGAIGRRLAELLGPFRMKLAAVRRHARGDEAIPIVDERGLDALLPHADHLVDVLPGGVSTRHFVDGRRLTLVKPGACFYNVGRGSTVDQTALASALASGRLRGAWLDVTDPEPLPIDHALWITANCHITPHSAGGQEAEPAALARHFLENLRRHAAGEELLDRVI